MKRVLGFLLGVLLSVPVLAVDCTTGQKPWSAAASGGSGGTGDSAYEACAVAAVSSKGAGAFSFADIPGATCNVRNSSGSGLATGSLTQVCMVPAPSTSGGTTTVTVTMDPMVFPDIFQIDSEGGAGIAGAILAVWAVAWGFRMVIRTLNVDGKTSTSESES